MRKNRLEFSQFTLAAGNCRTGQWAWATFWSQRWFTFPVVPPHSRHGPTRCARCHWSAVGAKVPVPVYCIAHSPTHPPHSHQNTVTELNRILIFFLSADMFFSDLVRIRAKFSMYCRIWYSITASCLVGLFRKVSIKKASKMHLNIFFL